LGWQSGSSDKSASPEFNPQCCQKNKNKGLLFANIGCGVTIQLLVAKMQSPPRPSSPHSTNTNSSSATVFLKIFFGGIGV
jgi:hypothetical protein